MNDIGIVTDDDEIVSGFDLGALTSMLSSDENVKEEEGPSDGRSWAVAMEDVNRRTWDWDESAVRNLGFLLSEFRVLLIRELAMDLRFLYGFLLRSVLAGNELWLSLLGF